MTVTETDQGVAPAAGPAAPVEPLHVPGHAHGSDAVFELSDLANLYRARAASRVPVRVHDRSPVERAVRREVARVVLEEQLPALVAELLAAATDDLSPEQPTDLEAAADVELRTVEAVERCKAVLDGVALEALARLHGQLESAEQARFAALGRPSPAGWVDAETLTVLEVSTATGLGQHEVAGRVRLATTRTPAAAELRHRLGRGNVSLYRACTLDAELRTLDQNAPPQGLDPGVGVGIVEAVLRPKDGAPPSPTLFRQRLTRACLAADRDAATRRRQARRRRGAHARIDPDGLGVLTVVNDADKIAAAMDHADTLARAARQAGDPRTLDALRADVVTDLLLFGATDVASAGRRPAGRRPPARVTVVVPVTTLAGLTDAPCELPGHGWVDAAQARQVATHPDSTWQRLLVDAATGVALRLETTGYRPTAAIRAHVEAVDGTCRGPGCTVPAARCDLDHDLPWPHGPTATTNLTAKHRTHHNLHTHAQWQVSRDPDTATVQWRTAAGRRYTTQPRNWLDGLRAESSCPPTPLGSERARGTPGGHEPPPF